ncbi:zinc finger protein RFP-like [Elgaria multicarinata webbii]|uniref:zinc finger protein RFP-like n=1 Tax=Elgaria multicarinata webbii TaxID=159646 RepID=UPI002FCCFFE3
MAAADPIKGLCEETTCPICLERFEDPVILDCGHNYCRDCLAQYFRESDAEGSCPQCRKPFQQSNFRPNWQLANLVELVRKLQEEKKEEVKRVCERHQEPLKLFCKDDQAPICTVCDRSKEHKGHDIVPVEEVVQEFKDKIQPQMKSLEKEKENLVNQKAAEELRSQECLELLGEEQQKVKSAFEQLHKFLEEKERVRLAQLLDLEKEIEKRQEENLSSLSEGISQLSHLIAEMEEKCQQSTSEFLHDIRNMLNRCEKEQVSHGLDSSPGLDERLRLYLQKNNALENAMEKCRAANVTLDPDTAHPDLVLSEDWKGVKWEGIGHDLPDNPERFNKMCSVLGRERFTSGEHWWEVEVEGRIWETWSTIKAVEAMWAVGVARESVTRKGKINHYPNEGIWAVGKPVSVTYTSSQFWAFTSPGWTPLAVRSDLRKIRVYLDCEKGSVKFVDADTDDLIFSFFPGSFCGESIRPYFWVNSGVRMKC